MITKKTIIIGIIALSLLTFGASKSPSFFILNSTKISGTPSSISQKVLPKIENATANSNISTNLFPKNNLQTVSDQLIKPKGYTPQSGVTDLHWLLEFRSTNKTLIFLITGSVCIVSYETVARVLPQYSYKPISTVSYNFFKFCYKTTKTSINKIFVSPSVKVSAVPKIKITPAYYPTIFESFDVGYDVPGADKHVMRPQNIADMVRKAANGFGQLQYDYNVNTFRVTPAEVAWFNARGARVTQPNQRPPLALTVPIVSKVLAFNLTVEQMLAMEFQAPQVNLARRAHFTTEWNPRTTYKGEIAMNLFSIARNLTSAQHFVYVPVKCDQIHCTWINQEASFNQALSFCIRNKAKYRRVLDFAKHHPHLYPEENLSDILIKVNWCRFPFMKDLLYFKSLLLVLSLYYS